MIIYLALSRWICQLELYYGLSGGLRKGEFGKRMTVQPGGWLDTPILDPLRRVKGGFNQLMHRRRRQQALARIRALGPLQKILIVCTGNVCRSPYAEARLKEDPEIGGRLEVASSGWMGANLRVPPVEAQAASSIRGVDMGEHKSQTLTREHVQWADLVVVMAGGHRKIALERFGASDSQIVLLGDLDPELPLHRSIPDPMDRPPEFFQASFDRIDRCVEVLLQLIKESA